MKKNDLIRKILEKYTFKKRKKENEDSCPCYNGTKCHDLSDEELICLFCLCPEYQYDLEHIEGGCKIDGIGKWFYHNAHPTGRIWDCSDCSIPHTKEYVNKYLNNLSIEKLEEFLNKK